MNKVDVLIIGAGPTGLMLACQLERYGISFIILDSKAGTSPESRALVVSSRSLEIYRQLGEMDKVNAEGQIIESFDLVPSKNIFINVNIGAAGEGITDFPYIFSLEQNKNEEILYEHLKNKGGDVQWNTGIKDFNDNADEVIVAVSKNGIDEKISCRYLVGCDGAKSFVRHKLNLTFEGGTYESKFFLADADIEWNLKEKKILGYPRQYNLIGFFPLKDKNHNKNHYRILGTLPAKFYDNDDIEFKDIEYLIRETYSDKINFKSIYWFTVYKLHHRCVNKFKEGNVFVAGDAAHIHSPAGGQGMNTGLQDAFNLAWKLSFVINGIAGKELLETYNAERLPFAKWLMNFTDRGFEMMSNNGLLFRLFRRYAVSYTAKFIFASKTLRKRVFRIVSQLHVNYEKSNLSLNLSNQKLKFTAGDLIPYIKINDRSLIELITLPKFHIMIFGNKPSEEIIKFAERNKNLLKIISIHINDECRKHGIEKDLTLIIRPDQYIGLIADSVNENIVRDYFHRFR
ncbi:MAG: FAD-dependent monooxygenase [Ignavibacteria bacterium]